MYIFFMHEKYLLTATYVQGPSYLSKISIQNIFGFRIGVHYQWQ
jgi:hypothetical protein